MGISASLNTHFYAYCRYSGLSGNSVSHMSLGLRSQWNLTLDFNGRTVTFSAPPNVPKNDTALWRVQFPEGKICCSPAGLTDSGESQSMVQRGRKQIVHMLHAWEIQNLWEAGLYFHSPLGLSSLQELPQLKGCTAGACVFSLLCY